VRASPAVAKTILGGVLVGLGLDQAAVQRDGDPGGQHIASWAQPAEITRKAIVGLDRAVSQAGGTGGIISSTLIR